MSSRQDEKEILQLKKLKLKVPLETVAKAVCGEFTCRKEQIITKGRKKNKARGRRGSGTQQRRKSVSCWRAFEARRA